MVNRGQINNSAFGRVAVKSPTHAFILCRTSVDLPTNYPSLMLQRFRAGSLSFTAPINWSGVTLGQFLDLSADEAPDSSAFIITTLSGLPEAELRAQPVPYDFDAFVLNHLGFINTVPPVPDELPKSITVGGQVIKLPKDLGASALLGQMWDVDLVIRSMQKRKLPVDPVALAEIILPVFLWPLLKSEPYTDRHQAHAELWPIIRTMPCIEGLAASGFFLRSSLSPMPSGIISVEALHPTPLKRWPQPLRRVWTYLRTIIPVRNWRTSFGFR